MSSKRLRLSLCLLSGLFLSTVCLPAQVTRADYERAMHLRDKYKNLALNVPDAPNWVEDTDTFWYRKTVEGGHAFVLVDAGSLAKRPAFDHEKLAAALSSASGEKYSAVTLPFSHFEYAENQSVIRFRIDR